MTAGASLLLLATAAAASPTDDASPAVRAARERLTEALKQAKADGFVRLKTDQEETKAPIAPPAMAIACPDGVPWRAIEEALGDDPLGAIATMTGGEAAADSLDVAFAYLSIGLFDEAAAIARAGERTPALGLVAATARLATAGAAPEFAPVATCGPLAGAMHAAADRDADPFLAPAELSALSDLPKPLLGPVAERLSVRALEAGDARLALSVHDVAVHAQGAPSDMLVFVKAQATRILAASPTPLDELVALGASESSAAAKALIALADEYEALAQSAYDGFLADLQHASKTAGSAHDRARAALAEARLRAKSGETRAAVAAAVRGAKADPSAYEAAKALARASIASALSAEERDARLPALDAYASASDLVRGDASLDAAALKALAELGAVSLVRALVPKNADGARLLGHALLRDGDPNAAIAALAPHARDARTTSLLTKASLAAGDEAAALAAARAAPASERRALFAEIAWRAGDFAGVCAALRHTAPENLSAADVERLALSALASGGPPPSLPEDASPALAHFRKPAPKAIAGAADFADGVGEEIEFMKERITP